MEFDEWYRAIVREGDIDDDLVEHEQAVRRFFRGLYEREGAVSGDRVEAAFRTQMMLLAERGAQTLRSDVERTTELRPRVEIGYSDEIGGPRIRWDGSTPAFFSIEAPGALAEIADELQLEIMESLGRIWPCCQAHDAGLYPQVEGEVAVWWCRRGAHAVAPIGGLPAAES